MVGDQVCLKVEATRPSHGGGGGGGGGGASGFNCIANPAALARCQVHFTMWTIMKVEGQLATSFWTISHAFFTHFSAAYRPTHAV